MKKKNQAILLTVLLILSLLVQAAPSNVLSEEFSAGENSSLTEAAVTEEIPQENTLPGGGINTTAEPAPETSVVEEATLNDLPAVEEPAPETPANEEQAPDAPAVTEPASPAPGTEEPAAESPVNETTQAEATMAVNVNLNDSDGNPLASFTLPSGELLGTLIQYLAQSNPAGIFMQLEDGSVFQGWSLQPGGEIVSPEQYTLPVVAELNLFAVYSAPVKSEGEEPAEAALIKVQIYWEDTLLGTLDVPAGQTLAQYLQSVPADDPGLAGQLSQAFLAGELNLLQQNGDVFDLNTVLSGDIALVLAEAEEEPSEYLDGPDAFDDTPLEVPIDYNIYPETDFGGAPARMKSRSRANDPPVIGVDHPTLPGEVMLFKEAKKVDGMLNTFDVTLRMEAMDVNKKSDIVLVIDKSGSMEGTRMTKAKEAASAFVDRLLPSATTRIAVVSFASEVVTNQGLTSNAAVLHTAINSLSARGGTFTQAGIKQAEAILANSDADLKHIVFLSDGEPTYSYRIGNGYDADDYFSQNINPNIDIPQGAFTGTRCGNGSSMLWYATGGSWLNPTYYDYHNHGNNAIAESGYAKAAGYSVWSIALEAGSTGTQVLNAVASPGQSYTAAPDDLNAIFAEIAGKISSAMQEAHVTDPMGAGFQIPVGEVSNIQAVPASPAPTYDTSVTPHKLTWEPGTVTTPIYAGSDVKYAELKYRVVIDDGILNVQPDGNGNYDTNGDASVSYIDINGNLQTPSFPKPNAKPIIIKMEKVLMDSRGNVIPDTDQRRFNFNLKLQEEASFNQDYEVKGNAARVMTDLRIDKNYTLTENGFSGTPASSQNDYEIDVKWQTWDGTQSGQGNANSLANWQVPKDRQGEPLNTTITVTNKEKADGKLTIRKTFDPEEPSSTAAKSLRADPPTFAITVVGKSLYSEEEIYREIYELAPGEYQELTNLHYGIYTVSEEGKNPSFHETGDQNGNESDGVVRLSVSGKEAMVEVVNHPDNDDFYIDLMVKKTWLGGKPAGAENISFNVFADGTLNNQISFKELNTNACAALGIVPAENEVYYETEALKYNAQGLPIVYTIREKNIPAGYISSVPAQPTEHTYKNGTGQIVYSQWDVNNIPQKNIVVTKHWNDADNLNRAGVRLTLYRTPEGGSAEAVTDADVFTPLLEKNTNDEQHIWTALPLYSDDGKLYTYSVKEEFVDANDINNQNWTIVENNSVTFAATAANGTVTVTNKAVSGEENLGKLIITKKALVNGTGVRSATPASRGEAIKFSFKVTGPNGYEETFELAPTESRELKNLYFGDYTVEETNTQGYTASYAPNQTVTLTATDKEKTVEVSNTGGGSGTVVEKTIEKIWVNGPKPSVTIELWRKNNVDGAGKIDEKVDGFDVPANASGEQLKKTFSNLAKHDPYGNEFEYYVKEETVPPNYTKSINGMTVTNRYTQPQTENDIIATKTWANADSYNPKPEIKFELWRKNGTAGDGEKVQDATALTSNAVNFGKQLKTDINGVEYTYFVKELFTNAEEKDNWTVTGEGSLELTNTLKGENDRDGKLTIKKILENEVPVVDSPARGGRGPSDGSLLEFSFTVMGPGGYEESFTLKAGEEKTIDHLLYGQYTVTETPVDGFDVSYDPANGKVTITSAAKEKTVTVTNTNNSGADITVTLIKVWVNGPETTPATTLELWRKGQELDATPIDEQIDVFAVPVDASEDELRATFENLPKYDPSGREFEYYAKEPEVPENYEATIKGLTVTNTYVPPTEGEAWAEKIWVNADGVPHPAVYFKLYRQVEGGAPEAVPGEPVQQVPADMNQVGWDQLQETDLKGRPYTFSVREVDAEGNDFTPDNFIKHEAGLKVTNKYVAPGSIIAVDPPVEKQITGTAPVGASFTFQMRAVSYKAPEGFLHSMTAAEMPMPMGSVNGVKRIDKVGPGSVEFGQFVYDKPGTYVYEISEVSGANTNCTYDTTVYTMTDTVKVENGTLELNRVITKGVPTEHTAKMIFVNRYQNGGTDEYWNPRPSGGSFVVSVASQQTEQKPVPAAPIAKLPRTGDTGNVVISAILLGFAALTLLVRGRVKK